jgi:hypothetical protein
MHIKISAETAYKESFAHTYIGMSINVPVRALFNDIFDVYVAEPFISRFLRDGKMDVSLLLNHNMIRLNVVYGSIWNCLYKTYPTKKDFVDLLKILELNPYTSFELSELCEQPLVFDNALFEKIVNSFVLRTKSPEELYKVFTKLVSMKDNVAHEATREYILDKLRYRYAVSGALGSGGGNLIVNALQIINTGKKQRELKELSEIVDPKVNPITKSINHDIAFSDNDYLYMNELEKAQYIIYKDIHFLLKIVDKITVYTNGKESYRPTLDFVMKMAPRKVEHIRTIPAFFRLIPRIAHSHITLSHSVYPQVKPLCSNSENAIFAVIGEGISDEKEDSDITREYDRYIIDETCTVDLGKVELEKYLICQVDIENGTIVSHPDFIEAMWSAHMTHNCPIRSQDVRHGVLLYNQWVTKHFLRPTANTIAHSRVDGGVEDGINAVVLIDNRPNIMSVVSVMLAMRNLDRNKWKFHVFTSSKAIDFYQQWLGYLGCVIVHEDALDIVHFDIDVYNRIVMDTHLWTYLEECRGFKKCLIIQDDGVLFRPGMDQFLKYDYIGAPWVDCPENAFIKNHVNGDLVGNGGFSLRTVSVMRDITTKYEKEKRQLFYKNMCNIPEDVYFCKYVKETPGSVMPSHETASLFSSEEILNDKCIGDAQDLGLSSPFNC